MRRVRAIVILAAALAAVALTAVGCVPEQRYVAADGGGPWAIAIDENTPPFFMSRDGTLYILEQRIEIPYRQPTQQERAAESHIGNMQIPWSHLPWLTRGDVEIQIDYTISNLDTANGASVAVTVNGFNEFQEYNPGVEVVDNKIVPDYSGWERTIHLDPGARYSGTVRQEQLDEVATDLATVVNGAPNANLVLHPNSQSALDPRVQAYIPDVIPELLGVRMGMRAQGDTPPKLLLEMTVRVTDVRGVLVQGDAQPWTQPTPALFGPADAAAAAGAAMTP